MTTPIFVTTQARHFVWEPFNAQYGGWWRLKEVKGELSVELSHGGHGASAEVIPDWDGSGRWRWGVKFAAYRPRPVKPKPDELGKPVELNPGLPERRFGGHADSRETAMKVALQTFLTGRLE
jgi:hypothetical protein